MSIIREKINEDLKTSMKARDQHKVTTLRGILAAVKQIEVDTRTTVDDNKLIQVIQKEIKMRRDALEFAHQQSRTDLIEQNKYEIDLIQSYLGTQLSESDLQNIIKDLVASGMNSIGQIMGSLNSNYKGQFEGKIASEIIKNSLG